MISDQCLHIRLGGWLILVWKSDGWSLLKSEEDISATGTQWRHGAGQMLKQTPRIRNKHLEGGITQSLLTEREQVFVLVLPCKQWCACAMALPLARTHDIHTMLIIEISTHNWGWSTFCSVQWYRKIPSIPPQKTNNSMTVTKWGRWD